MAFLNTKYYTFNKLNAKKWIYTKLKINLLPNVHIVDRYFAAVKKLNVKNDYEGLDFFFPEDFNDAIFENKMPASFIALAIGGTYATKRYPTPHLIDFCRLSKLPIVLLGGKSEQEAANEIELSNPGKVINFCNKLSITESAFVLKKSSLVISNVGHDAYCGSIKTNHKYMGQYRTSIWNVPILS